MCKYSIGIVLATCNGEKYLHEQLESLLNQTFSPSEIVIVDDCSIDNTILIAKEWQCKYPGLIKIFNSNKNSGYIKNFERGISFCDQDFIALADQDDIWEQDKLEKCVEKLRSNPGAGICYHNAKLIDYKGYPVGISLSELNHESFPLEQEIVRQKIIGNWCSPIRGFTIVFENALKKYLLPMPGYKFSAHDWWITAIAFYLYDPVCVNDVLVRYRIHNDQVSGPLKNILNDKRVDIKNKQKDKKFFTKLIDEMKRVRRLPRKIYTKKNDPDLFLHEMHESFQRLVYYIKKSERLCGDEIDRRVNMINARMKNNNIHV